MAATVACTVRAPAVFLIDVVASWQGTRGGEGKANAVAYVLAPEKVIFLALVSSLPSGGSLYNLVGIAYFSTIGTDLCAILAIAAALHSGVAPPALMVGYGMTALAGVFVAAWFLNNGFKKSGW